MAQPPTIYKPGKLNYLWNYLGSSLKSFAAALSPYINGGDNGVKRYKALLNQSGIDDPVATILENTLGGVPVWTRAGDGVYDCILAGAFPIDKVFCTITYGYEWGNSSGVSVYFGKGGNTGPDDMILTFAQNTVQTDPNNAPGNDICVLIEVYP